MIRTIEQRRIHFVHPKKKRKKTYTFFRSNQTGPSWTHRCNVSRETMNLAKIEKKK